MVLYRKLKSQSGSTLMSVQKMTNRDKFNSMNNAELADILSRTLGADTCKFCCYAKEKCLGKSCTEGIEAWLNASCAEG